MIPKEDGYAPTVPLDGKTLVMDYDTGQQIMFIEAVITPPIGTVFELWTPETPAGSHTGTVRRVRMGAPAPFTYVILDVEVTEGAPHFRQLAVKRDR